MTQQTPLHALHEAAGGKMVDFAGWSMPVNYGSQINEHIAVRTAAGMFDVSHMTIIDVSGEDALAFLRRLVANDVAKLEPYGALYGALLNEHGGVLDDLIVYRLAEGYRCVVNASTRDKVLAWFERHALSNMAFTERDEAMIAVQGPEAIGKLSSLEDIPELASLKPFNAARHGDWLIGRTGYTGEDGVEVMLPNAQAVEAMGSPGRCGCVARRSGCPRYTAPGGRPQSVRSGPGRRYLTARLQHRLDHRLGARGSGFHRSRRHRAGAWCVSAEVDRPGARRQGRAGATNNAW